ncbi:MAG: hypothetical protein IJ413_04115 [Bacteroides sp.]|nr:hypothetical protein [Bacteroides sp.]
MMDEKNINIYTQGGPVINGGTFSNVEFVANKYVVENQREEKQIMEAEVLEVDSEVVKESPLRNHIFNEKIFDTNDRLIRLRNCIASAIDMGDATIMYGKPQDYRINPEAQNEWYYIVKAIEESGVAKKFAVTQFIEQMQEWFPTLFPSESKEEWEKFKRRLSKSISEEKGLWKHGKMKEVIPLRDMWAKQRSLGMDAAKMERIYAIAHQGLLRNLDDLKQEITKEKSR